MLLPNIRSLRPTRLTVQQYRRTIAHHSPCNPAQKQMDTAAHPKCSHRPNQDGFYRSLQTYNPIKIQAERCKKYDNQRLCKTSRHIKETKYEDYIGMGEGKERMNN